MKKLTVLIFTVAVLIWFVSGAQAARSYSGWKEVVVPGVCSMQIPPTMEVQTDKYRNTSKAIATIKGWRFHRNANSVVVQQKGLNSLNKKAFNQYARIIVSYKDGENTGFILGKKLNVSRLEINELCEQYLAGIRTNWKILKVYPAEVCKIADFYCLHFHYVRSGWENSAPVEANYYITFNGKRMHSITTAFRQKEASLWKKDLENAVHTLKLERQ